MYTPTHTHTHTYILAGGSGIKSKGNKNKIEQLRLHQAKVFLHSKANHQQNEKATYLMGKNICKAFIW